MIIVLFTRSYYFLLTFYCCVTFEINFITCAYRILIVSKRASSIRNQLITFIAESYPACKLYASIPINVSWFPFRQAAVMNMNCNFQFSARFQSCWWHFVYFIISNSEPLDIAASVAVMSIYLSHRRRALGICLGSYHIKRGRITGENADV